MINTTAYHHDLRDILARTNWKTALLVELPAVIMLKMNDMLLALLVGWNAVVVSSAETPAMPTAKATQYLSKGKTCVSQHSGKSPQRTRTDKMSLAGYTVCCTQTCPSRKILLFRIYRLQRNSFFLLELTTGVRTPYLCGDTDDQP